MPQLEELLTSSSTQNAVKLTQMALGVAMVTHLLACGWGWVGRNHEISWMDNYRDGDDMMDVERPDGGHPWSVEWAVEREVRWNLETILYQKHTCHKIDQDSKVIQKKSKIDDHSE